MGNIIFLHCCAPTIKLRLYKIIFVYEVCNTIFTYVCMNLYCDVMCCMGGCWDFFFQHPVVNVFASKSHLKNITEQSYLNN